MIEKKSYISQILMSTFFVFIFAPLEMYISNSSEFFWGIKELLPALLMGTIAFLIFGLILFWLTNKISKKLTLILCAVLHIVTVGLYIQGNYVIARYGSLDGTPIDWSQYKLEAVISIILWLIMMVYCYLLAFRIKVEITNKIITTISIILLLTQVVTMFTLVVTHDLSSKDVVSIPSTENEFTMSKSDDIVVLIVDSMDSRAFNDVISEDSMGTYGDLFDGFTYYRNTLGTYLYTELAVPHIISGLEYDESETYMEYLSRVYSKDSLLADMENKGYKLNLYLNNDAPIGEMGVTVNNYHQVTLGVSSHRTLLKYIYKLLGFRYLPYHFKQLCWFYPDEMDYLKDIGSEDFTLYDWDNFVFYDGIDSMVVDGDDKVLHIYHIKGPHQPYTMKADFTESDSITGIQDETKAIFVLLDKYFEKLKECGVYDNTSIVVLADHGVQGNRQSPTLLVKEQNSSHPFDISDAPLSYTNLKDIFATLSEGKAINADEYRSDYRYYLSHYRDYSRNMDNQRFAITKYVTKGDSFDDDSVVESE